MVEERLSIFLYKWFLKSLPQFHNILSYFITVGLKLIQGSKLVPLYFVNRTPKQKSVFIFVF
jgi:hypothetical protein